MLSQWNLEESICERYETEIINEKTFEQAMLEISNETEELKRRSKEWNDIDRQ